MGTSVVALDTPDNTELGTPWPSIESLLVIFQQTLRWVLKAGPWKAMYKVDTPDRECASANFPWWNDALIHFLYHSAFDSWPSLFLLSISPSLFHSLSATVSCLHSRTKCCRVFKTLPLRTLHLTWSWRNKAYVKLTNYETIQVLHQIPGAFNEVSVSLQITDWLHSHLFSFLFLLISSQHTPLFPSLVPWPMPATV